VVDPAGQERRDQVFFGATVTYADEQNRTRRITIVGADEARLEAAEVSLVSPIARALLKARVGDCVPLATPAGIEEIEVLEIAYPAG
jgi:transcription elongation factor GreB